MRRWVRAAAVPWPGSRLGGRWPSGCCWRSPTSRSMPHSDIYLRRDLDRKVRTIAATELASSTDGPGIHLHPLATDALAEGEFAEKFVQIFSSDGRSGWHRRRFAIVRRSSDSTWSRRPGRRAPLVSVVVNDAPGARRCSAPRSAASATPSWLVCTATTSTPISPAWPGCWVSSGCGLATTAALGYWLASRASAPVVGISRRAARIAQGDFAARLDPPERQDEVGEMTRSLNEVLDRLHGALEAHRASRPTPRTSCAHRSPRWPERSTSR